MKWKQRIAGLSIKKKIILYTYAVVLPIIMIIGSVSFFRNYKEITETQNVRGKNRVQNLETNLAELNQSVSELATYICINQDVAEILKADNIGEMNRNSKLWLEEAPMRFVQDTLAIKGYMKTLAIYPENGVQPYIRCLDASACIQTIEEIRATAMYQTACEKRGKQCWKRIEKNSSEVFWANPGEKIVLYRAIFDLSKKHALGYMTIGIDARKYTELCESALEEEGEKIIVLNAEGDKLLSCGNITAETEKSFIQEVSENSLIKKNSGVFPYLDEMVYFQKDEGSGQTVCLFVPNSSIKGQLMNIGSTTALMMFGVIIGLFPVLSFVSGIVTKPLKKVNAAMGKFREGDFEQRVEVETQDEVGEVAVCFNQMVTDIKKLIDEKYIMEIREKESELTALQAQINPHFLYNTLDSLYWQAQEADNEEIAENILALSNLFRQVLGAGKSITTVEQECALVKEYLTVQKMRFTKRMHFELEVEESILGEKIPKLILQPFVENAVVHGLETMDKPCDIFVRGKKIAHGMEFVVEDTGVGMTKEQVKEILNTNDAERYRGQRVGRYAIKNVKERLTLMYHERFEMAVESAPGKGTKIILRIYEETEEKNHGEKLIGSR